MICTQRFEINPVPASRPRVSRWSTYYPKKYTKFKQDMEALISELDTTLSEKLVRVEIDFMIKIPESWSKKKKASKNGQFCDNNADLDNYEKSILDSLSGIYFHDDRQIVKQKSKKIWADQGYIDITLAEV